MDHAAHSSHIGAVAASGLNVDVNLPVDAGQGQGVLDQRQAGQLLKLGASNQRGLCQIIPIVAHQAQVDRLGRAGALCEVQDFGPNAGEQFQPRLKFGHDRVAAQ